MNEIFFNKFLKRRKNHRIFLSKLVIILINLVFIHCNN